MKKIKLLSAVLLLSVYTANAQWVKKFYVDDFGDKTEQSYNLALASGSFSNSATQNSRATYHLIDSGSSLTINVYEYNRSLANDIDATFETFKIKDPDGLVYTIRKVFFSKSGKLFFPDKQYSKIMNIISKKGDYTMVFSRTGNYSKSSYRIKLKL